MSNSVSRNTKLRKMGRAHAWGAKGRGGNSAEKHMPRSWLSIFCPFCRGEKTTGRFISGTTYLKHIRIHLKEDDNG